jgi:hypothetical protein
LGIRLFTITHPLSLCTKFRYKLLTIIEYWKIVKNNVPEITGLLRIWPMLEFFGGKTALKGTVMAVCVGWTFLL